MWGEFRISQALLDELVDERLSGVAALDPAKLQKSEEYGHLRVDQIGRALAELTQAIASMRGDEHVAERAGMTVTSCVALNAQRTRYTLQKAYVLIEGGKFVPDIRNDLARSLYFSESETAAPLMNKLAAEFLQWLKDVKDKLQFRDGGPFDHFEINDDRVVVHVTAPQKPAPRDPKFPPAKVIFE